jgi:hypothetical protein
MITKVKTLQTALSAEDFILTGSMALMYHGLVEKAKVNDIDLILVNPSESARAVLDSLQAANPSPKFRPGGPVNYSFFYEGTKVDVWIKNQREEGEIIMTKEGVQLSSVKHIAQAKKNISRPKDWISLMQIAKQIYDPAEFEKILPNISLSGEYTSANVKP